MMRGAICGRRLIVHYEERQEDDSMHVCVALVTKGINLLLKCNIVILGPQSYYYSHLMAF